MSRFVFEDIPSTWRLVRFSDVCEINPGFTSGYELSPDAEVTFVPMSAVDEIEGRIRNPERRSLAEVSKGYTPFREGDVLFAKITPSMENGKAAIATNLLNGVGFGSTEFHVLRPRRLVLAEWLFAFIRQTSFRAAAKASFVGTAGQQRVPARFLENFGILLPPLSEQHYIVDILRYADELRRLRRQADEQVENLPAALFYEVFLKDEKKLRHWGSIKLGKVAPFVTSGSRGWAKYYADSGSKFIRVQNVLEGELDFDDLAFVQPPEGPGRDRSAIMPGDLLITITGTVGRVAVAPDNIGEAYVSQHVAIARLDGSISPQYVAAFLNHPLGGQLQIARQNYGQTKPGLNLAQIQSLRIPRPPDDLIAYFENQADGTRKVRLNCSTSAMMLDELSQSLLARAFTGKLTAAWREQHTEALAAEARQRDQALGLRARVVRPVEPEVERVAVPLDETHPRYTILRELSSVQQQVYQAVLQTEGYFTAENLMTNSDLSPDITRRALTLLETLGLVVRVGLPFTPTSDAIFYVSAHRTSQATDDGQGDDLATLKSAHPE